MSRFRIGVKPGYGPVIKVMRDPDDDPWTTPNTDWDKFIINSEVQEIAYGHTGISHTFVPADYNWTTSLEENYWPNEANWVWRADCRTHVNGDSYLFLYANLGNIPGNNLNAFHFIARDASDWIRLWTRKRYNLSNRGWYYRFSRMYWFAGANGTGITYYSDTDTWTGAASLWPTGVIGESNLETSGPNTQSYYTTKTFKFTYYNLELPTDNSPYPSVIGTPSPGKKILRCSPTMFRMAKPGFDVDTATTDQMLFSEQRVPLKVIRTGTITLAPAAIASVDLGAIYPSTILVDYQVNALGEDLFLPPMRTLEDDNLDVDYRISGQYLEFRSSSSFTVEVRFFVMSVDDLEPSAGTSKVFEASEGGFVVRRPNTAGTRLADVILDTRFPTMPIIKQGWIPFASMTASDVRRYGTHRAIVNFDSKGYKPYVLARLMARHKTNTNTHIFRDFCTKSQNLLDYFSDSSFSAIIKSNEVWFYCSDGNQIEDIYYVGNDTFPTYTIGTHQPLGIRYYIFAVPSTV